MITANSISSLQIVHFVLNMLVHYRSFCSCSADLFNRALMIILLNLDEIARTGCRDYQANVHLISEFMPAACVGIELMMMVVLYVAAVSCFNR